MAALKLTGYGRGIRNAALAYGPSIAGNYCYTVPLRLFCQITGHLARYRRISAAMFDETTKSILYRWANSKRPAIRPTQFFHDLLQIRCSVVGRIGLMDGTSSQQQFILILQEQKCSANDGGDGEQQRQKTPDSFGRFFLLCGNFIERIVVVIKKSVGVKFLLSHVFSAC